MFSQNIKKVIGFDDYYVGDDGIIYSTKKNGGYIRDLTPMKLREDKDGYLEVGMYKDGKRYFRRVHRVVAEAFIPNPKHLPQINHKDGNVKNNNVDNLEWCDRAYNTRYGSSRIRAIKNNPNVRKVAQYSKRGELIARYGTIAEASRATGLDVSSISKACSPLSG